VGRHRSGDLIARFVFTPTPFDLELERKYGFDAVLRLLQREDIGEVLDAILPLLEREGTRELLGAILPYQPERKRGRPQGQAKLTRAMLASLKARIKAGEPPTRAARALLIEHGAKGEVKGRADYLVRQLKRTT
jgi:hypothetical protein